MMKAIGGGKAIHPQLRGGLPAYSWPSEVRPDRFRAVGVAFAAWPRPAFN